MRSRRSLRGLVLVAGAFWLLSAGMGAVAERVGIETPTLRSDLRLPARGARMEAVARDFGEPQERGSAVGDPPITRWFYDQFTVYFEHDRVIHSVVVAKPSAPAPDKN